MITLEEILEDIVEVQRHCSWAMIYWPADSDEDEYDLYLRDETIKKED